MLARLEARVAEQQRFAANASHELRIPLAIARTFSTSPGTIRTATPADFRRLHAGDWSATTGAVTL